MQNGPGSECFGGKTPLYAAYRACIAKEARRLEPSGGSAESIASAALAACAAAVNAFRDGVARCIGDEGYADRILSGVRARNLSRAMDIVRHIRSART